jgi:hypothetical protein
MRMMSRMVPSDMIISAGVYNATLMPERLFRTRPLEQERGHRVPVDRAPVD